MTSINLLSAASPNDDELTKNAIRTYWNKRSAEFAALRRQELESDSVNLWRKEILPLLPEGKPLHILDVGTGSGFLALLLAAEGHQTIGIDLSPSMIAMAEKTACHFSRMVHFAVMDAEQPDFAAASFDVVISRNLTWTLPNPVKAYQEWLRLLKPNGVLINFDADYGHVSFEDNSSLPHNHAHQQLKRNTLHECEQIKQSLAISEYRRPDWDMEILRQLGATDITVDKTVSQRLYPAIDKFYNPTPLFLLTAHKEK